MQATISKWGNSLALRLPRRVVEDARLTEGATVELQVEGDQLVITRARPKYRLADLLVKHTGGNKHEETDWGPPRGREEW